MTTSREIITGETIRLRSRGCHTLVSPLERLDRALGVVPLSDRTEGYVRRLMAYGDDGDFDGLTALIRDRDHVRDERMHELLDELDVPRLDVDNDCVRYSVLGRLGVLRSVRGVAV